MNKIWFTSDTHFGSERTLELSKRPFLLVNTMDKVLIKKWNEKVAPDDTVFHLGDFGEYKIANILNGNIRLLFGNYEWEDYNKSNSIIISPTVLQNQKKLNLYYADIIIDDTSIQDEVEKYIFNTIVAKVKSVPIKKIILSHEPRINSEPTKESGIINLFGHIHGRQFIKKYGLDVGVDPNHFYPISLDDVCFYINALLEHYDEYVFN